MWAPALANKFEFVLSNTCLISKEESFINVLLFSRFFRKKEPREKFPRDKNVNKTFLKIGFLFSSLESLLVFIVLFYSLDANHLRCLFVENKAFLWKKNVDSLRVTSIFNSFISYQVLYNALFTLGLIFTKNNHLFFLIMG